jgi:ubiquinone biosynthesis protein
MNIFSFIRLIIEIYLKKDPDLKWIQKQGLLAIKIGQIHALRIDFLDGKKCRKLAKLYTQTKSIPAEDSKKLIDKYGGNDFRSNFEYIEETPFASASIGQVHRAKLKTGEDVVIKIIKGDFKEQFVKDVESVRKFFKLLISLYPRLKGVANPLGIVNDIEEYTLSELDLRNEVKGQETLKKLFEEYNEKFDLSTMKFARIYGELSSENIMVSEYLEGKTFDRLLEESNLEYSKLLDLFHNHGFYMFIVGTFHGDLHPGNVIYSNDLLYFVDTGFIGNVGEKIRVGLFNFFSALSKYDYPNCAYYLNKMAEVEIDGENYEKFKVKLIDLYSDFTDKPVSEISLTKKMMQTIKLGVNSGMVFEKGMFSIIRSLMYMDGMVLKCNPGSVLMKDMGLFIDDFKKLI